MRASYLFTSESVAEGHPDKVSDQVSDAIVDLMLGKDPESRVACETMTTTQRVILSGEIRCAPMYDAIFIFVGNATGKNKNRHNLFPIDDK